MSTFTLTLDTTGPHVTWGAQTGGTAGDLLELAYNSTEPLAIAQLVLPDARRLPLTVELDTLTLELPDNTPAGVGDVLAYDDVGNVSLDTFEVALTALVRPATDDDFGQTGIAEPAFDEAGFEQEGIDQDGIA